MTSQAKSFHLRLADRGVPRSGTRLRSTFSRALTTGLSAEALAVAGWVECVTGGRIITLEEIESKEDADGR
jgi:hypothetical protein